MMFSKIIGITVVLIGLALGIFFVRMLISLADALPEYRAGLAAGLVSDNPLTPEEWLHAERIPPIIFLALSLLLVIAGCLVALSFRFASAVCVVTATYAVVSYVFVVSFSSGYGGVDFVAILLLLLAFLGTAAFVSSRSTT
jgi:hypothetical protein